MTGRTYCVYDVFADTALAGNPLAVVFDAKGLEGGAMQRIAREFNLSETVFVLPPDDPHHTARLRIFTPGSELPFAGHPTVGSAVALAERVGALIEGDRTSILVLEETVGAVRCAVKAGDGPGFAEFDLPRLPEVTDFSASAEAVAAALGIAHHEIGFENHTISAWSAGVPFVFVPVVGLEAASRARLDAGLWHELASDEEGTLAFFPYIYCRETVNHDSAFHSRMFAPEEGIGEDPATGAAAAAFAGVIRQFDEPVDGSHRFLIEQGIEMGRPSRIRLEIDIEAGAIDAARIGGHAVKVAEGELFI